MFGVTLMIGLLVVVGRCFGFWLFGCLLVWFWLRLTGGSWFWFAGCRRGGVGCYGRGWVGWCFVIRFALTGWFVFAGLISDCLLVW